jgi:preprotein translocase SecE subunit
MDEIEPQDEIEVAPPRSSKLAVVVDYVTSARREMDKVTWPARDELTNSTRLVVIGALGLGMVIGLFDYLLNQLLIHGVAALVQ